MPTFDGTEGGIISPATAREYLSNYAEGPTYALNLNIKAHYFGRKNLDALLSQKGAVGLRAYYGLKPTQTNPMEPELILVAVDKDGNDVLENDLIVDFTQPCPPVCPAHGL
jgi:hypothetical protein